MAQLYSHPTQREAHSRLTAVENASFNLHRARINRAGAVDLIEARARLDAARKTALAGGATEWVVNSFETTGRVGARWAD